jgi:hypothetical protein
MVDYGTKYLEHNRYHDIKNAWAPTARLKHSSSLKKFLLISLYIFSVGFVLTICVLNLWLRQENTKPLKHKEVMNPIIMIATIPDTSKLINYASPDNGARIILEETSPLYHGIIVNLNSGTYYS